jgi:hypothetical protein
MKILTSEMDYISWMFEEYFRFSDTTVSPLMSEQDIQEALEELHPESFPCIGFLVSSPDGSISDVNYISREMVSDWATALNIR